MTVSIVVAADNTKLIDNIFRNRREAVAKATDKSRNDAISQLTKLATRAYTEKDRLAETNAWKAVLTIDPTHSKAKQYFKDLGTLEQVQGELPQYEINDESEILSRFVGKWKVTYNNGSVSTIEFGKNGTYTVLERPDVRCEVEPMLGNHAFLVTYPGGDHLNRYTLAGDRLLVEQWGPASRYPAADPAFFGRAVRAK